MVCRPWEIDNLLHLSMGMRFMTSMMELQSSDFLGTPGEEGVYSPIQLLQERLSEKVHATIPKGLWVVLSSLCFKEICKNGMRDHGLAFAFAKGKQQK